MKHITGFITIQSQVDNAPNKTALIGELSRYASSFRRDVGIYSNPNMPGVRLSTFTTEDDGENVFNPTDSIINKALEVGYWISEQGKGALATVSDSDWYSQLINSISHVSADLELGQIVNEDSLFTPESVKWTDGEYKITLYFTDHAFIHNYDKFDITVIDPVEVLNDLHRPDSELNNIIQFSLEELLDKATEVSRVSPYTKLVPLKVRRLDPGTGNEGYLYWVVAIYGKYGDNPITIQEHVMKHILDNSDYNPIEWYNILPDLFRPKEFSIVPMWNKVAHVDHNDFPIFYSPMVGLSDIETLKGIPKEHVSEVFLNTNMTLVPSTWKNLQLLIIGGVGNENNLFNIHDKFPDYIEVALRSPDHNRPSTETQGWMEMIEDMLRVAESIDRYSDIPNQYSKVRRKDVDYLIGKYNEVNYLVVTKYSYEEYLESIGG